MAIEKYQESFNVLALTWTINHNFGAPPSEVAVWGDDGNRINLSNIISIIHTDSNTTTITFSEDKKGYAQVTIEKIVITNKVSTKSDPGDNGTDPKFHSFTFTTANNAGPHYIDLTDIPIGAYLQGIEWQIKDPKFGDTIDLLFASDGNFPNPMGPDPGPDPLPVNYTLQTFGPKNAPMKVDSPNGWGRGEVMFSNGLSKQIPPNIKARFKYTSIDSTVHQITIDVLMHQV